LQIDSRAILWDVFEHKLEVALEGVDVSDLIPGEVGPQEVTAVSPSLTIRIEDAMAQKRSECSLSVSEAKVLELQTQDRLDVFRLTCYNERLGDDPVMVSVTKPLETLSVLLQ
jgi:hypothetical protein